MAWRTLKTTLSQPFLTTDTKTILSRSREKRLFSYAGNIANNSYMLFHSPGMPVKGVTTTTPTSNPGRGGWPHTLRAATKTAVPLLVQLVLRTLETTSCQTQRLTSQHLKTSSRQVICASDNLVTQPNYFRN